MKLNSKIANKIAADIKREVAERTGFKKCNVNKLAFRLFDGDYEIAIELVQDVGIYTKVPDSAIAALKEIMTLHGLIDISGLSLVHPCGFGDNVPCEYTYMVRGVLLKTAA